MPETETGTREVQQLRRCIRDLVALSAFPAVCVGYAPLRIAESLADVLRHMLDLDFLYLAVRQGADGIPLEVAHTSQGPAPADRVEEIRKAIGPSLKLEPSGKPSSILDPFGSGTIPIVLYPFGTQASSGFLAAGSRRADFPNETDRLLLSVGANHLASLLERRRAEETLRESEERFRGTFENAAVGIIHSNHEGRWLRSNQKLCDILGYTPEELLGRTFPELTYPDDLAANLELFGPLMRGTLSNYSLEKRYIRKDGSLVWGEVTASLQRDAAGQPAYCIAIVQDISERKRLEAELREAKEAAEAAGARVTRILESITDAFYALDRDWRFTYINPQAEPLLRRSRDELLGKVVWDEFPESVGSAFDRMYHEALATGRAVTLEEYYPPRARWFEVRAYPSADGLSVYFRDVTERRRADEALRLANARLDLALRGSNIRIGELNMPDGVLENGRWESISAGEDAYAHIDRAGWPTDFATVMSFVHPDDRERGERAIRAHLSGQTREFQAEYRVRNKDGSYYWRLARGVAVRDAEGGAIRFMISSVDITELKRIEEALRESEQRFRTLTEALPQLVWTCRPDGDCDYLSRQWVEYTGVAEDEQLGDRWVEALHPDDRERTMACWRAALDGRAPYDIEHRIRAADGTYRWFQARGLPLRDELSRIVKWFGTCTDIDDQKRAEEALRESERRFRTLAEAVPHMVWTAEPDGAIDYFNARATEYTGLTPEQLRGWDWRSTLHPEDLPRCLELWTRSIATGELYEIEHRLRRFDGAYRWHLARALPLRDKSGRVTKWFGSCIDLDDQKRAAEVLSESERRFRTLAEALPHMVWTAEPDGVPDYLNARNTEYTGLAPEQLRGGNWQSTVHPEDVPRVLELWTRSTETGELFEAEYRLRRFDGAYRWHLARVLAVRDDSGRITKWFGSCVDIDDQMRAQEVLREAKEAAEAASRAKDEFLANVSHEIRTPMNAILGMTELALDTPLTAEQRDYLAIVKASADALLKVINDLLDFAKIEAGKLELDHADFSLRHVLGETLRALALRAHRRGLELVCRIQPEVPDLLIGDAGRLRQVLLNLIGNAIKFTEQGEVVVRVEAGVEHTSTEPDPSVPGSRPSPVLHFAISDTGIGIPREKQEKIFQAFEQGDNSTTRQYEGTGLGLSIAARLVALMGGQTTVESEPGRGSTFRFTAEFGAQPAPPSGPPERPLVDLHGLRVLVVDDNATNRQILEEWLRGWHMEPLAVADGFKALDALWSAVSFGRPFALVLLDARMPGTDGLAVAESIRQNPVLSTSRIILLTSEDLRGDLARYRELGIAAYAMKPVPQEELLEIIYRVLSRPDSADVAADPMGLIAAAVSTAATTAPSARRLRILVAEDNPFNQQLVEHLLRRKGHDIRVASDGREALAALEQDRFDLMLLDVHMPGCDGFQVIEALRQREEATGGHLPVIALTARATQSDRERCLQAGMDEYLAKPIAAAELFRVMERVLSGRPAAEPELPGRGRPETLLAPATLLAACDDDPTLLRELIQVFRADTPGALARVRDAVDQQDASRLREAAHELRGLLSTFSAMAAAEAARLETMGAGGQLDDAASTFDGLAEMVGRLGPDMEELSIEQLRHQAAGGGPV